jgi:hypothetical protein
MLRTALDSDNLAAFTPHTDFILTYSDLVLDAAVFEAAHRGQQVAYIDRGMGDPGNKASIIDIETGTHTVAELAPWHDFKAAHKVQYLTWYASRDKIDSINAALGGRRMYRWVATLDGTLAIPGFQPLVGPDLVQLLPADKIGVHADFSIVLSPTWRPAPLPPQMATALTDAQDIGANLVSATASLNRLRAIIPQL